MQVWIETRYAVDLRDGNVDFRGKLLQLISWQITKLLLDRPELVKQGARVPLASDDRAGDLRGILPLEACAGEYRSWDTRTDDRTCTDVLAPYQTVN